MVASMGARYGVGLVDHPKTQNRVGHVLRLPRRFLGARSIRGGADDGGNAVIAFGNARQGVMICLAGLAAEIACLNRCDADGADGDEELIRKFQVEENMSGPSITPPL